jgi:hypothetical protein
MAAGFGSLNDSRLLDAGTYYAGQVVKTSGAVAGNLMNVAADADKPAGVLQSIPASSLEASPTMDPGTICVAGEAIGLAGAAVAIDDDVVVKFAAVLVNGVSVVGTLVPKSAAGYVVGKALTAAASGEFFQLLVNIRKEPA